MRTHVRRRVSAAGVAGGRRSGSSAARTVAACSTYATPNISSASAVGGPTDGVGIALVEPATACIDCIVLAGDWRLRLRFVGFSAFRAKLFSWAGE